MEAMEAPTDKASSATLNGCGTPPSIIIDPLRNNVASVPPKIAASVHLKEGEMSTLVSNKKKLIMAIPEIKASGIVKVL